MKKQSIVIALTLASVLAAAPAFAGIHYKSSTTTEDAREKSSAIKVEGWVSGDSARVEFKESWNPMLKPGAYLISKDGGETIFLVDPEEKTYAEWDLRQMLGAAGAVMNGMGPLLKLEFTEPKVEKLLDEAGPAVVGLPTRHVRYRTSYTLKMKVMGMGSETAVVSEEDIWTTDRLQDAALAVWLRADPPKTGNDQLDKLIASGRDKYTGFPLKTVAVTTSTNKKNGKATTSRTTMEVTELDTKANVPASSFAIPAGYEQTEITPMPQQGRER